ncbi:MAG: iron ABC transporter permease [Candidatus Methanoplasma sp.]|jgi:iron complex transport system permease protein|nr:iron ABC transporter permease [Candidatus Methanoplasma sp.]
MAVQMHDRTLIETDTDDAYDLYGDDDTDDSSYSKYKGYIRHKILFLAACLVILFVIVLISVSIGVIDIPFLDVLKYLFTFDTDGNGRIIWDIRLMRVVACILVGAGLAVAGVVMQCILRNPLASPYTLGLSSAAAFGASFAIVFLQAGSSITSSISISNPYIVTISAFAFSLLATGIILLLTKVTRVTAETMVLAGVAISAIFAAGLSFMQYIATDSQLANIVSWSFGDMGRATWDWNIIVFAVLLPVALYFLYKRWDYNAMEAGEETAKGLGVNTERERIIGMVLAALVSSVIVSFFGIVAFIGLLGPHIARMIIGGDHRYLIPAAIILGAIILLISDIVGMNVIYPVVIPVGIITSVLGGPLFIYLLIRRYR